MDSEPHGVAASQAPTRPSPIDISTVRLLNVARNLLRLADFYILDGIPVLNIKPYVPDFDEPEQARLGWLEGARGIVRFAKADARFK